MPEEDEEEETRKKQFSKCIKLCVYPESSEGRFTKTHARICSDSSAKADKKVTKRKGTAARNGLEARKAKVVVVAKKKGVKMMFENQWKFS